ncbi:hypothetical protein, partial [Prosthecochloris sp.]|uniref:hypothetical protein n=1 Tax=Prosthecochloris sp. TaxID=290513 RepID=UPI0025EFB4AE
MGNREWVIGNGGMSCRTRCGIHGGVRWKMDPRVALRLPEDDFFYLYFSTCHSSLVTRHSSLVTRHSSFSYLFSPFSISDLKKLSGKSVFTMTDS